MQIVIEIDEDTYHATKEGLMFITGMRSGKTLLSNIVNAIANGTPLPKGHGRLVDADVMINKLCTHEASEFFGSVTCAEIIDFINDEKPIIEADKTESENNG